MNNKILDNILKINYFIDYSEESKMPYEGQFIGE